MHRGLFIDGPCWNKGSQSSCCTLLPEQLSVSSFFVVVVAFFFFFGKLGHRCFMAAKYFETFSYVQWEKMPLQNSC